jgi:hypothetical protein
MHSYNIPDPEVLSEPEVKQIWSIACKFNAAAERAYTPHLVSVSNAMTEEEAATMGGMISMLHGGRPRSIVEAVIGLQSMDLMANVLGRVDPALVQSCVPAEMHKPEVADLFKKYDLPALEKLAR